MTQSVVFAAGCLAILSLFGVAVLAPLRPRHRAVLLPAAPLLGAALLAVVLSSTSIFLATRTGVLVAVAVAVGLLVTGWSRGRRPWRLTPAPVAYAVLAVAAGVPGAVLALLPSAWVGDTQPVSANPSHDVFYYVSEAAWLLDHPVQPAPVIGAQPSVGVVAPSYAPMAATLSLPMRFGQPLVHAALAAILHQPVGTDAMVIPALWVALLAPAAFTAARLLHSSRAAAGMIAVASASSALLVQQAYQQNFDSLLGAGLALLAIACAVAAARRTIPLWPAALVLSSLVAVYTEYALYVAPAIIGGLMLAARRGWRRRVWRSLLLLGVAVLLAPVAWLRGLRTLMIRRDGDLLGSPFFSDGAGAALSRVVGASPLNAPQAHHRLTAALVGAIIVGLVGAVLLRRDRGTWIGLLGVGGGYIALLTVEHHGYTQMRAVVLFLPLVLLASGLGWDAALRRLVRRWAVPAASVFAVLGTGVLVALWTVLGLTSAARSLDRSFVEARHVDRSFAEAASWVDRLGGDGNDVSVAAPDMFDQLWLAYALRNEQDVSYLSLRPDYLGALSYWAGETDRYLLVGRGAAVAYPESAVVARNARFVLLDTAGAAVVAAVPQDTPSWYPFAVAGGMGGPDRGHLVIWRSQAARSDAVVLAVRAPQARSVSVTEGTSPVASAPVRDGVADIVVAAVPDPRTPLEVDLLGEGASTAGFTLIGARPAG